MFRKILFSFSLFIFLFSITPVLSVVFAQESIESLSLTPTPILDNSYTFFWPVVAGKTVDDKLFFLKELKEKFTGMFIFGEAEKADYAVQLSTKRIVETEKLLKEDKESFAVETLGRAETHLSIAKDALNSAKEKNKFNPNTVVNIKKQIENLNVFLPHLKSNAGEEIHIKIDEVYKKVDDIKVLFP